MLAAPDRPALRYHGGKWRLASWIIGHFPIHRAYVEPFAGGAGVLLQKRPSEVEVYNDINGVVVNFFRVLRERPDELVRAIELTPFSRAEFVLAHEEDGDEVELARRFYVLAWQGRGGPTARWNVGWRWQRTIENRQSNTKSWSDVDHLYTTAERLKAVQIECLPASKVIAQFDHPAALFYLDPPYVGSTRSKWRDGAYGPHEMSDADHRALAEQLRGIKGMAIISGYPSALYEELYQGWLRVCCETTTDVASIVTECLWISPAAAERGRQLSIFEVDSLGRTSRVDGGDE